MISYGQWSYTFTDPCTLNQQTIQMGSSNSIALNYFGNVQTFTQDDFTNGTFDSWMDLVTQANSSSPCQSVTQVIVNTNNSTVVANTLTVVTSIMSIMGGGMLPPADAIGNSTDGDNSEEEESSEEGTSSSNSESSSSSSSGSGSSSTGSSGSTENNSNNNNTGTGTEGSDDAEEAEGGAAMSTANSISNALDGGDGETKAQKGAGSLIASGTVV